MTNFEREKILYAREILGDLLDHDVKSNSRYCVTNGSSFTSFGSFDDAIQGYITVLTKVVACGQDVGEWRIQKI